MNKSTQQPTAINAKFSTKKKKELKSCFLPKCQNLALVHKFGTAFEMLVPNGTITNTDKKD